MVDQSHPEQLLHLVFGGELTDLGLAEFRDLSKLDIVGIYPNYAAAYAAWKTKAQQTVDNAHLRYFIVHLHRLLDPEPARRAALSRRRLNRRRGSSVLRACARSRRPPGPWRRSTCVWYGKPLGSRSSR